MTGGYVQTRISTTLPADGEAKYSVNDSSSFTISNSLYPELANIVRYGTVGVATLPVSKDNLNIVSSRVWMRNVNAPLGNAWLYSVSAEVIVLLYIYGVLGRVPGRYDMFSHMYWGCRGLKTSVRLTCVCCVSSFYRVLP